MTTVKKEVTALTSNKMKLDTPVDYSFMKLITPNDLLNEVPRGLQELKEEEKYKSKCIRLNNNHLTELIGLVDCIVKMIDQPNAISWIDLSFNELTRIDPVLCEFPGLQILYLHGNSIAEIGEVEKLTSLPYLKKLSLHGNPIENFKNYRLHILSLVPGLVNLDMSTVTMSDRSTAEIYIKNATNAQKRKKKRKNEDED